MIIMTVWMLDTCRQLGSIMATVCPSVCLCDPALSLSPVLPAAGACCQTWPVRERSEAATELRNSRYSAGEKKRGSNLTQTAEFRSLMEPVCLSGCLSTCLSVCSVQTRLGFIPLLLYCQQQTHTLTHTHLVLTGPTQLWLTQGSVSVCVSIFLLQQLYFSRLTSRCLQCLLEKAELSSHKMQVLSGLHSRAGQRWRKYSVLYLSKCTNTVLQYVNILFKEYNQENVCQVSKVKIFNA